jgi:transcriptional regulator with XRE-family HTH domain
VALDSATIGKRLAAARKAAGLTQEKVAGYLGIKREVIAYYETGARPVTTAILLQLADLYGYKLSYFLEESRYKEERSHVVMAFRAADLCENDLRIIAEVKRIASNLDSLYGLLEDDGYD